MNSTRCAVCKYFRRRCPSDCIFSPYFPANNPQRFVCVHRIYGASNIGKMLEQLPVHLRGDTVESLYYEAKCRIQDPVYGCVRVISLLHQEIHIAQSQLAKAQAEIAFLNANSLAASHLQYQQPELESLTLPTTSLITNMLPQQNTTTSSSGSVAVQSTYGISDSHWFD